jgi:hypothetical protein
MSMKKSEFSKLVRPIIKEELYKILGEVLPSLLSEAVVCQMATNNQKTHQSKQPSTKSIRFSSDPVLNELLNQTKGGISEGTEMVGLEDSLPVVGNSSMMKFYGEDNLLSESDLNYSSGDHGQKIDLSEIQKVAPEVAGALTRDYSSLMKAIDKKKHSNTISNIDFSKHNG